MGNKKNKLGVFKHIIVFAVLALLTTIYYYGFDFTPDHVHPNERFDWYNTDPLGFGIMLGLFVLYIIWSSKRK